jgi:S1-C subfamily serine protease
MIARLLFLVCLVAGVVAAQSAPSRKNIPAIARAANGVIVSIITSDKDGKPVAQGTGFLVSTDGRIVTNYHVIKGASSAIVKLPDGAFYDVDGVVAFDKARDLAVIKAHGQNFRVVTLGNSDRIQVGEEIVAIGSPLSLESTVSSGIVSGIRTIKEEGGKFLQITAPISPGSSGGPLFNMAGEVVGITTLYLKGGENLNFAIPVNDAKLLLSAGSKVRDFPVETSDPLDGLGTPATPKAAPTVKTVSEILDWIQTHLETITTKDIGLLVGVETTTTSTSSDAISFEGCQVTVTWTFTTTLSTSPTYAAETITRYGPVDLGGLRSEPEHMELTPGPDDNVLRLFSIKPFLIVTSNPMQSPNRNPDGHNFPLIFATQNMAERQQKAWHDAIILCGGKKTKDDLY